MNSTPEQDYNEIYVYCAGGCGRDITTAHINEGDLCDACYQDEADQCEEDDYNSSDDSIFA